MPPHTTLIFIVDMSARLWGDSHRLGQLLDEVHAACLLFSLGGDNRSHSVLGVGGEGAEFLPSKRGHREEPWADGGGLQLSHALTKALCVLNKRRVHYNEPGESRVALVLGSDARKDDHMAVMNAAFVATSEGVRFDVLWAPYLLPAVGSVVQQAVAATGGAVLMAEEAGEGVSEAGRAPSLLALLLSAFVASRTCPGAFRPPPSENNDARTICVKTQNPIETGNVCSVCFSVFHLSVDVSHGCPTCGMQA